MQAGFMNCTVMFPNTGAFFILNLTTMLVNMVVMMISFFFSYFFNETKLSLGFGAGIPIAFLIMNMLGGISADVEIFKKLLIHGFYDPVELVRGGEILSIDIIYISISAILFVSKILTYTHCYSHFKLALSKDIK